MNTLLFFLVALALGKANPIGPTTTATSESSREDRIKTAIDNNVQWLLRSIRNGSLEGPDLARAVVALFLAEPGFFSPGHEVGQELRDRIRTALTEVIRLAEIRASEPFQRHWRERITLPSYIPSEELAWFLQALLVSCENPYNFLGYDLTDGLYKSVIRHHCNRGVCVSPPPTMLALCNARAVSKTDIRHFLFNVIANLGGIRSSLKLADEEKFLTMTFGCLESSFYPYPEGVPTEIRLQYTFYHPSSEYRHYPSNLTVEDFQEFTKPDADNMVTVTVWSLSDIAAAMQNLMFNHRLRVSDLPWAVDILLAGQEVDGSWGQSTLNSLFILPVLSNKSFLDITSEHCPVGREIESQEKVENRVTLTILVGDRVRVVGRFYIDSSFTLYNALTGDRFKRENAIYHNGTDGEPYLASLIDKENNPETGYFWFTYEQTRWPKESFTLLNQSHTNINIFKPSSRFMLWYRRKSEEEIENDQNEIQAGSRMES